MRNKITVVSMVGSSVLIFRDGWKRREPTANSLERLINACRVLTLLGDGITLGHLVGWSFSRGYSPEDFKGA